jgi:hypothetical protein
MNVCKANAVNTTAKRLMIMYHHDPCIMWSYFNVKELKNNVIHNLIT